MSAYPKVYLIGEEVGKYQEMVMSLFLSYQPLTQQISFMESNITAKWISEFCCLWEWCKQWGFLSYLEGFLPVIGAQILFRISPKVVVTICGFCGIISAKFMLRQYLLGYLMR